MTGIPYVVVARRPEHDFRIVEVSSDSRLSDAVKEEARWLSLDWWGNCFARTFDGALGHFRSTLETHLFFLMLVVDGPVAPDRFVAFLHEEEYSRFGFNPFRALEEGLFAFAGEFYSARNEKWAKPGWWGSDQGQLPAGQELRMYAVAERYLAEGNSILVPCHTDLHKLRTEIRMCLQELSPETRKRINVCSFTNAARDHLNHFGPILCSWYTTAWHRSLHEVLAELPGSVPGGPA